MIKVYSFDCPFCGFEIEVNSKFAKAYCNYCGSEIDILSLEEGEYLDYYDELKLNKKRTIEIYKIDCSNCNREIEVNSNFNEVICNYCGNVMHLED